MRLPRPLPRADLVWLALLGIPSAIDYWCDQGDPDSDTLSERVRYWFHTDTPAGRFAFTLALGAGATWLHSHILKEAQ